MKNMIKRWLGIDTIEEQSAADFEILSQRCTNNNIDTGLLESNMRVLMLQCQIMDIKTAAEKLEISVTATKRLVYAGELIASKISNVWVVNALSLGQYQSMIKDISDDETKVSKIEE